LVIKHLVNNYYEGKHKANAATTPYFALLLLCYYSNKMCYGFKEEEANSRASGGATITNIGAAPTANPMTDATTKPPSTEGSTNSLSTSRPVGSPAQI
jgi:hypothetical protein